MLSAFLCSLALAPGTKLTLDSPAIRVSDLLAKVEAQTKEPYRAAPDLAPHWMAVRMEGEDPADFRTQLARVLRARWARQDGVYRLVADAEARRAQAERLATMQTDLFKKFVDEQVKSARLSTPFTETTARALATPLENRDPFRDVGPQQIQTDPASQQVFDAAKAQTPYGRAAAAILALLPSDLPVRLPSNERHVLAWVPTESQIPLPRSVGKILAQLVAEQNAWASVARGIRFAPRAEQYEGYLPNREPLPAPPVNVLIDLWWSAATIRATARFVDQDLRYLATIELQYWDDLLAPVLKDQKPMMLDASPEMDALSSRRMEQRDGTDPALLKRLVQPDRVEPHSYGLGFLFRQIAAKEGRPMLAHLNDDVLYFPNRFPGRQLDGSRIRALFSSEPDLADNRWLLLAFGPPRLEAPIDRKVIARFAESLRKDGSFSLENAAALARELPSSASSFPSFVYHFCRLFDMEPWVVDLDMARFYAYLTPQQKESARTGKPIPIREWTPSQRQLIMKVLRGPEARTILQPPLAVPPNGTQQTRWQGWLFSEPTYVLAQGLPPDTRFTLNVGEETSLRKELPDGGGVMLNIDSLAYHLGRSEVTGEDPYRLASGFRMEQAKSTEISILFGDRARLGWNYVQRTVVKSGATVDDLSKSDRETFNRALQKYREQFRQSPPGRVNAPRTGGGGSAPPP